MTRTTFTQRLYAEYFLLAERDSLRAQFEALKQGKLSLNDYTDQFTRLERFARGVCPKERDRILRFKAGLNDYLRQLVFSHNFTFLYQATNTAREQKVQALVSRHRDNIGGDRPPKKQQTP